MDKKNRRYEIQSKVHVPNMDDIQRAASDFSEAKEDLKHDFIVRNAKNFISTDDNDKYIPQLNEIKKEMVQLAMVVASSEAEKAETVIQSVPSDEDTADADKSALPQPDKTEEKIKPGKNTSAKKKS